MFIRSTLVLASLALALPLAAQDADAKAGAEVFYKAYFLDNDQASSADASKKALGLYKQFLAANPKHDLAAKAANRAMILMYSTGDLAGARAFAKTHSGLISKAESAIAAARQNRAQADQEVAAKLMDAMRTARDDGDDAEVNRIRAAMSRGGAGFGRGRGRGGFGQGGRGGGRGQGGRGGFGQGGRGGGRGRGGRGGGGVSIPKIAEMKPDEAKKAVDTLVTALERTIDFMAQRGQADQADKLEAKLDKIQDLVDDGKLADAQKILDTLEADLGAAGGGRGGRGQGGRRGGGAGGQGGRRGGGQGGAGAGGSAGGERRRR